MVRFFYLLASFTLDLHSSRKKQKGGKVRSHVLLEEIAGDRLLVGKGAEERARIFQNAGLADRRKG